MTAFTPDYEASFARREARRRESETAIVTLSSDAARKLADRLLSEQGEVTLIEFLTQLLGERSAS